jgi:2-dehydropantoate 2-reductase
MVEVEGVAAVMDDVVLECLEVARAAGVTVPGDLRKSVPALALGMPAQYSSTAQDLMRGKPSEIDHLNGYVVQRGLALGVQTPVNRVLHTLVKMLETKAA